MLFNSIGEPNVTTLLISDELDISPGNLYYHFKSKGDIVGELFASYEHEMHDLLAVPEDATISLDQQSFSCICCSKPSPATDSCIRTW